MFEPLPGRVTLALDELSRHIDAAFPPPARFAAALPKDIAALSRLFTDCRSLRRRDYLSNPPERAAYLRYFLPWNVFRLCRLFAAFDGGEAAFAPLRALPDGAVCADLGSGPLAVPLALWISFPALRVRTLRFYCVDRSARALDEGRALFTAYAGAGCRWDIRTVKADVTRLRLGEKAALVSACGLYNELYDGLPEADAAALAAFARKAARALGGLLAEGGLALVAEPGSPRSGQFVSRLRRACLEEGLAPSLPCPHRGPCAMKGGRRGAKWCHIAFDTAGAPARLKELSQAAGLAKERATMSFLLARKDAPPAAPPRPPAAAPRREPCRVIAFRALSDPVALPDGASGVYACSAAGLALLYGPRSACARLGFGALVRLPLPPRRERDKKSGALRVPLDGKAPRQESAD